MIPFEGSGTPVLKLSELSDSWKHYLSNEKVQQVQIEVDLRIADRLIQSGNATTYYADLRQSFLGSYKKEQYFQFSVLRLDTAMWRLQGRSSFKCEVHLRRCRCSGTAALPSLRLQIKNSGNIWRRSCKWRRTQRHSPESLTGGPPRSSPLCSVDRRPRQPPARRTRRELRSGRRRGPWTSILYASASAACVSSPRPPRPRQRPRARQIIAAAVHCCVESSVHDFQWSAFVQPPTVAQTIGSALTILLGTLLWRLLENSSTNKKLSSVIVLRVCSRDSHFGCWLLSYRL